MRVLALPRYTPPGPSSRVRMFQFLPFLESQGVEVTVAPLLDDEYVRRLYQGERASVPGVAGAYLGRVSALLGSRSYDLLWIEKELLPWLPPWAERILAGLGTPYVADYDDAVFHRYDLHRSPLVRRLLGKSIAAVMRHASLVVAGNEYLAAYARRSGAGRVELLPSVVDSRRFTAGDKETRGFYIGWLGTPVTARFLESIGEALAEVTRRAEVRLVLVGVGQGEVLPGVEKEIRPWRANQEVQNLQSFDVGIMPLPDSPFERGKCGYKLIQYMACGLPVVASPVGANNQIVEHGRTGFLAATHEEWVQALLTLFHDPGLGRVMGQAGRVKVEEQYSLQIAAPRLLNLLESAAR